MRRLGRIAGVGLATFVVLQAAPAAADPTNDARALYNAGVQAYTAGRYADAADVLEQAYKLAPKSTVLFSLAQAEKKQFFATTNPEVAKRAAEHYRKYLETEPNGPRRADATQALEDLQPTLDKLARDPNASVPVPIPSAPVGTASKLYVSASIDGAHVFLDDRSAGDVPFIGPVAPGKHRIKVVKEGYDDETREILVEAGARTSVDLDLKEKPSSLRIEGDPCDVYVDGHFVGRWPAPAAFRVPSGTHALGFVRTGKKLVAVDATFERGREKAVPVHFESSGQRVTAHVVLGVGAATFVTAGIFGALALAREGSAKDFEADRQRGTLSAADLGRYNDDLAARDDLRSAAYVTGAVALGTLLAGGALYFFDTPSMQSLGAAPKDDKLVPPKRNDFDAWLVPMPTPSGGGAGVSGRF